MQFQPTFNELLRKANNILITAHMKPDHDAITSVLSLKKYSEKVAGKSVLAAFEGEINMGFEYLPGFTEITWQDKLAENWEDVDLFILLDANNLARATAFPTELSAKITNSICIDHHQSEGEKFDLSLIDTSAAATAQLIFENLIESDKFTQTLTANLLAEGIMGDTGGLTYLRPSNSRVLNVMENLIRMGNLDIESMHRRFNTISLDYFPIFQEQIKNTHNIRIPNGPALTYTFLSKEFTRLIEDKV